MQIIVLIFFMASFVAWTISCPNNSHSPSSSQHTQVLVVSVDMVILSIQVQALP